MDSLRFDFVPKPVKRPNRPPHQRCVCGENRVNPVGNGAMWYLLCCDRTYYDGAIVAIGNVWLDSPLRPKGKPTPEQIRIAQADLAAPPPGMTTALYRRFDADAVLLYVGISDHLRSRSKWHARHSPWVPFAAQRTTEWFPSRSAAEVAEVVAIKSELPIFNRKHSDPGAPSRLAAYLQLYQLIHAPLKSRGVGSLRLDHFGKDSDKGSRGSSAKTQDVDHVWEMRRVDERKHLFGDVERIATTISMKRTHTRSGLGEDEFVIVRRGERVRGGMWVDGRTGHEPAEEGTLDVIRGEVDRIVDDLLAASVPPGLGRDKLKSWMTLKGMPTAKNDLMAAVAKELKVRQGGIS